MPSFVEQAEPGSVFSLLADENRVGILRALWQTEDPLSFSELHSAVDIKDSGQFNYHLDKLAGQFVQKTAGGYSLTEPGRQINGAIDGGTYTAAGSMEPIQLDPPCPTCGGQRTLTYEDERLRVECDSCDVVAAFGVPPAVFAGRAREEIPAVAGRYLRAELARLENGFCPYCGGHIECRVGLPSPPPGESLSGVDESFPIVRYDCQQCITEPTSGLTLALFSHPAVVAFYHDHGIDIRERSVWEFPVFAGESERIESEEPLRASTTFTVNGDELTLTVDEHLSVVAGE
ncbi:winged helix-turn-helix domain-containing protein [Halovenus sp. HT40]|uniref:winged helix-turn-helix domain-containing protein n=1 Tax=Halovenus sp. HT40 TaxID=3126691 RepID=UPI00300EF8E8